MVFQALAIAVLLAFYGFYLFKLIAQNRQSIKTNQMGMGNKPGRVLLIERTMGFASVLASAAGVCSILMVKRPPALPIRVAGLLIGVFAVVCFASAALTMKTSWRVGIPEEKTALVTSGIYQWSRNPAFVGFDLLYLSICLLFFNIPLLIISVWTVVMLHMQILQEEAHLKNMFGEEYTAYMNHTSRYWGRK